MILCFYVFGIRSVKHSNILSQEDRVEVWAPVLPITCGSVIADNLGLFWSYQRYKTITRTRPATYAVQGVRYEEATIRESC
jgi:hypothetical protein